MEQPGSHFICWIFSHYATLIHSCCYVLMISFPSPSPTCSRLQGTSFYVGTFRGTSHMKTPAASQGAWAPGSKRQADYTASFVRVSVTLLVNSDCLMLYSDFKEYAIQKFHFVAFSSGMKSQPLLSRRWLILYQCIHTEYLTWSLVTW